MLRRRQLVCSFCGKSEADVGKLVAGPKVLICDQCVALASQIMQGHSGDGPQPSESQRGGLLWRVLNSIGLARHRGFLRRSAERAVAR